MTKTTLLSLCLCLSTILVGQNAKQHYPSGVQKLIKAYPDHITGYDGASITMKDGSKISYAESSGKSHQELINSDNPGDIFAYSYPKGEVKSIAKNNDPGRFRSEELMKKMYGSSAAEVSKKLVTIAWCPKLVNEKVRITSVNGADKQLQKVSDELDKHPELKDYLTSSGGFYWRKISGTNRLSSHSFGIAIDISVKYSNYWQWDCRCKQEEVDLKYKNRIPMLIVSIFEKYGFIWGGKWYHYDTMHFEYRPELLID